MPPTQLHYDPTIYIRGCESGSSIRLVVVCSDFTPYANPILALFTAHNTDNNKDQYKYFKQHQFYTDQLNSEMNCEFLVPLSHLQLVAPPPPPPTNSAAHALAAMLPPTPPLLPLDALFKFNVYYTGQRDKRPLKSEHVSALSHADLLGSCVVSLGDLLTHTNGVKQILQYELHAVPTVHVGDVGAVLSPLPPIPQPPLPFQPPMPTPQYAFTAQCAQQFDATHVAYDTNSNYLHHSHQSHSSSLSSSPPPVPPPISRYHIGDSKSDSLQQFNNKNRMCSVETNSCCIS